MRIELVWTEGTKVEYDPRILGGTILLSRNEERNSKIGIHFLENGPVFKAYNFIGQTD